MKVTVLSMPSWFYFLKIKFLKIFFLAFKTNKDMHVAYHRIQKKMLYSKMLNLTHHLI
jgi:hypothetical protein